MLTSPLQNWVGLGNHKRNGFAEVPAVISTGKGSNSTFLGQEVEVENKELSNTEKIQIKYKSNQKIAQKEWWVNSLRIEVWSYMVSSTFQTLKIAFKKKKQHSSVGSIALRSVWEVSWLFSSTHLICLSKPSVFLLITLFSWTADTSQIVRFLPGNNCSIQY